MLLFQIMTLSTLWFLSKAGVVVEATNASNCIFYNNIGFVNEGSIVAISCSVDTKGIHLYDPALFLVAGNGFLGSPYSAYLGTVKGQSVSGIFKQTLVIFSYEDLLQDLWLDRQEVVLSRHLMNRYFLLGCLYRRFFKRFSHVFKEL